MKLPKELITVTPLSKTIALIMFTLLPIIAFILGMRFQAKMTLYVPPSSTPEERVVCTMDAKICPDGSSVGRTGPNCEFAPCPVDEVLEDFICGGIQGELCPRGYYCQYDGSYPDASGICVRSPRNDDPSL